MFGPAVLVGLGGILAEVLDDVAVLLAPVTADEVVDRLVTLRGAALLRGVRGRPGVDVDAVAAVVVAIGDLLVADPAIVEIDLNPVIAGPAGALAVDALVVSGVRGRPDAARPGSSANGAARHRRGPRTRATKVPPPMGPRSGSRSHCRVVSNADTNAKRVGENGARPTMGPQRCRGVADRRARTISQGVPAHMDQSVTDPSARRRTKRRRALFAILLGASFATLGAGAMSLAIFTDSDASNGSWTSGTIILNVAPATSFNVNNMMPGDSGNQTLTVSNTGTGALRYAMTSTADNTDGKGLRAQLNLTVQRRHLRGPRGHAVHRRAERRRVRQPGPGRQRGRPQRRLGRQRQPVLQLELPALVRQQLPERRHDGDVHLRRGADGQQPVAPRDLQRPGLPRIGWAGTSPIQPCRPAAPRPVTFSWSSPCRSSPS